MKKSFKENAGFTLIELIVSMAMAVIVTAAATSVLLMALRVNNQTSQTASQQITVQALLNVMEDAAADGKITSIQSDYDSWALVEGEGENARTIFSYDAESQTISTNGTPVLEGVYASNAIMEGQLLSISIETKTGTYTSAIYCRMSESVDPPDVNQLPGDTENAETDSRSKFIDILKKEYRSRGQIKNGDYAGQYYSQWYCGGSYDPGWNERTPWCACFVSWALNEMGDVVTPPENRWEVDDNNQPYNKWFADVDDFVDFFNKEEGYSDCGQSWLPGGSTPRAGDLIFFDWDEATDPDPDHVGVVLDVRVEDGRTLVYTIEGNSAGRVTIRSYSLSDRRIIGYGVVFPT